MKTMGLSDLRLVNPKLFPDPVAHAMSSGAQDVLDSARVCTSLDEALEGSVFTVGCTARRRDLSHEMLSAREVAPVLLKQAALQPVALVFGTEMSGLTNAELDRCQLLAHIPSNPDYSSLNLASAVQILSYELRCALPELTMLPADTQELAAHEEIELFYRELELTLISARFLNPAAPRRLMTRLRRLYSRTRLEKEELHFLMGIVKAMRKVD